MQPDRRETTDSYQTASQFSKQTTKRRRISNYGHDGI